jgi:hypothetical protein
MDPRATSSSRAHLQDGEALKQLALQRQHFRTQHPNLREGLRCVRIAGLRELKALAGVVLRERSQRQQLFREARRAIPLAQPHHHDCISNGMTHYRTLLWVKTQPIKELF